jgi:hypothetical protein
MVDAVGKTVWLDTHFHGHDGRHLLLLKELD